VAATAVISLSGAGCSHPKRGKAVTLGSQVLLISEHSGISDEKRRHEAPPVVGRPGGTRLSAPAAAGLELSSAKPGDELCQFISAHSLSAG
jgi:hypothetical protein